MSLVSQNVWEASELYLQTKEYKGWRSMTDRRAWTPPPHHAAHQQASHNCDDQLIADTQDLESPGVLVSEQPREGLS